MNDGINPGICSLEYTSVDKVAVAAWSLGRGALLDIQSAYRIIPVCVGDWHLGSLGMASSMLMLGYPLGCALPPRCLMVLLMPWSGVFAAKV